MRRLTWRRTCIAYIADGQIDVKIETLVCQDGEISGKAGTALKGNSNFDSDTYLA